MTARQILTAAGGGASFAYEPPPAPSPPPEPPPPPPDPPPTPTPPPGSSIPSEPAGWTRIFADDFLTSAPEGSFLTKYGANWTAYPLSYKDTSGHGWYDPGIISCHDSMMDMFLRYKDGKWRVAAPEPIASKNVSSVRITVRFKADPVVGFKTAWLMWPMSETWPRDGEIDYPEGDLDSTISAFMHRQNATVGSDQDVRNTAATYTSWHIATFEWVRGVSCAFYMDGVQLGATITSRVPNTPMRYVIQTETRILASPPPTGAQGHVYLDWITVAVKS